VIQDHFGLPAIAGNHPLRGPNDDELGPRFPAMSDCYDPALQAMIVAAAEKLNLSNKVRQNGTYCFVSGPCYETKAESRFLQSIGGDSVGMSTVPEVIVAKHCGMKILGLSLITNKVVLKSDPNAIHASHAEVLAAANSAGDHIEGLVKYVISKDVLGAYLSAIPTPAYKRKPVTDSKCCTSSDSKCGVTSTASGCTVSCPAGTNCTVSCPTGKCCSFASGCGSGDKCCAIVTTLGVAALVAGLFIVLKNRK